MEEPMALGQEFVVIEWDPGALSGCKSVIRRF